jgi:lysophospholipase L1-like esterase
MVVSAAACRPVLAVVIAHASGDADRTTAVSAVLNQRVEVSVRRRAFGWLRPLVVTLVSVLVILALLELAAGKLCCEPEARDALAGLVQRVAPGQRALPAPANRPALDLKSPASTVAETSAVLEAVMVRSPDGSPPFFRFRPSAFIGGNPVTNNLGLVMDHDVSVQKPSGVVRVVTLGASTTQGSLQFPGYRYPSFLQGLLRADPATAEWEVINAGHQGWGVRDIVESFREDILPLSPDIVIYYGEINDVARVASGAYQAQDHPRHVNAFVEMLKGLRQTSKLWSYYLAPNLDPVLPWTDSISDYHWTDLLKPWVNGLQDMLDVAAEHQIKVVLVTYAYAVNEGQPVSASMRLYADNGGWPAMRDPIRAFRDGINAQNEILKLIADERHVPLVNAADKLDGRVELFTDTVHMQPEGYYELAQLAAAGLTDRAKPPSVPGASSRPRVLLLYEPSDMAQVGDRVQSRVVAEAPSSTLSSIQLAINKATDGSANGDWQYIGSPAVSGHSAMLTFEWETAGVPPGVHRVAVNVQLAGGETVW